MSDKKHIIAEKDLELAVKILHKEIRMSFGEDRSQPMKEFLVHHLILSQTEANATAVSSALTILANYPMDLRTIAVWKLKDYDLKQFVYVATVIVSIEVCCNSTNYTFECPVESKVAQLILNYMEVRPEDHMVKHTIEY